MNSFPACTDCVHAGKSGNATDTISISTGQYGL